MLMEKTKSQKPQKEDEEKKDKYRWVQCPDIPDVLVNEQDDDDESPHGIPKGKGRSGDLIDEI